MGTFDIRQDAPGLLRNESLNITMKFERTGPNTGRISWNIPSPAAGCTADTQAYCGMLVTLDTTPASASKAPTDGTVYSSDGTADTNLFAGDKISTSLVVGAFYNDRTTTFFDVSGLMPNTPYFVTGFPVDCQNRYYIEGVHAYSQKNLSGKATDDTVGTQVVVLNPSGQIVDPFTAQILTPEAQRITMGVNPTDSTGLVPHIFYDFTIQLGITPTPQRPLGPTECTLAAPTYTITVDGDHTSTYTDLVAEINKQLSLIGNPAAGPNAPNTNGLYWDSSTQKLYQWDGSANVELSVIVQATDPSTVAIGTYWYDTTNSILKQWNGATWDTVTVITFATDPTAPVCGTTYWFTGTAGYSWDGTVWCQETLINQATDPSLSLVPPCGTYWYDSANSYLYEWDDTNLVWKQTTAVQSSYDPNFPAIGAYWYDETNVKLNVRTNASTWIEATNYSVSETAPTTPAVGKLWYNPSTTLLNQWNGTAWVDVEVISFPSDPTVRATCDLWWNTVSDQLSVWDVVTSAWVSVTTFYQQATDPTTAPTITDGTLWWDGTTLYVWGNACFTAVTYISWPTDPTTTIPVGTVWYDGTTWHLRDTLTSWTVITPIVSASDPTSLPTGTYWYDTTASAVKQWNGAAWVTLLFSTTPLAPTIGTLWFDSDTSTLMSWNGSAWVVATPQATVELDCNGNLLFTHTLQGSLSFVAITDGSLFQSLSVPFVLDDSNPGTDGVSEDPSYKEVGIGTDGSSDERGLLANEIRYALGYPVVDVELTPEQLDLAITRSLEVIRQNSAVAYKHGYFFMRINSENQKYYLTNKVSGMNTIVNILGVYRLTSSFLSSAHGAGIYGQIVLQHLYNMGAFDLLSYHIISNYIENLEILFAARVTFTWDEQKRELWLHHRFPFVERMVLIEAAVERAEQDIIADRWSRPWIRKYATAMARLMLAEQRGKYATLPGANGAVTLNAAELRQAANEEIAECMQEIFDYVADKPEDYGSGTQFILG